ncbi:MAG: aminoacyl-tRNA hydrolase [Bacteroidota bacterium]
MKYLIAGLGNIGSEYSNTRHNIGFRVIEALLEKWEVSPQLDRHGYTAWGKHRGKQILLLLPTTYMNLSGKAIRFHLNKHQIPLERLMVITDDLALPFGSLRMRGKGSDGGHNGLRNIQELLGSQKYPRLKFGVGSDFHKGQQVDYVLSPFTDEEEEALPELITKSAEGVLSFISIGLDRTMNGFNQKK